MDYESNQRRFESVFSKKIRAGKRRTYFFDVRRTKGDDYYLTITESTKKFNQDGYERHKIFLYKEDFNRLSSGMEEAINYVKTELMPDYDYDEFTRRHEEWEAQRQAQPDGNYNAHSNAGNNYDNNSNSNTTNNTSNDDAEDVTEEVQSEDVTEDDISW